MIANISDMEGAAMSTSISQQEGAMILFDFTAAFPHALLIICAFYHKSSCFLRLAGNTLDGFSMMAGVRQGCPLSPLLYVVAMDGLLRRMRR